MNGLVLPLMVTADLRFLAAFKKSLRLMAFHLSGVIGYAFIRSIFLLIKFIILIVMNLIVMFAIAGFSFQGMFEGQEAMSQNLTWISYMNPIGYFLCLILLPITILYDCYSLSFIAALTDGDDTSSPESKESISSDSPTPSAALPSDAPPSPPGL